MLEYSEITPKKFIVWNNEPYEVLDSHVFRKQQRKPVNQTKIKNLITGKVIEQSFHQSEKVSEAEIETKKIRYLFHKLNRQSGLEEYWFSEENEPSKRFELSSEIISSLPLYIRSNELVDSIIFNDKTIGIKLPIKVELKVTEAAPAVKGNTATGATKQVVVETGATVTTPLFVNEGDVIRVNTDTGSYAERVGK